MIESGVHSVSKKFGPKEAAVETEKEWKPEEKSEKQEIKGKQHWFNFFTKWFYIGIILVSNVLYIL